MPKRRRSRQRRGCRILPAPLRLWPQPPRPSARLRHRRLLPAEPGRFFDGRECSHHTSQPRCLPTRSPKRQRGESVRPPTPSASRFERAGATTWPNRRREKGWRTRQERWAAAANATRLLPPRSGRYTLFQMRSSVPYADGIPRPVRHSCDGRVGRACPLQQCRCKSGGDSRQKTRGILHAGHS